MDDDAGGTTTNQEGKPWLGENKGNTIPFPHCSCLSLRPSPLLMGNATLLRCPPFLNSALSAFIKTLVCPDPQTQPTHDISQLVPRQPLSPTPVLFGLSISHYCIFRLFSLPLPPHPNQPLGFSGPMSFFHLPVPLTAEVLGRDDKNAAQYNPCAHDVRKCHGLIEDIILQH